MDTPLGTDDPWTRSQLFTVRVWREKVDAGQWEVRIQVRHVLTGETRYFRDWSLLAAYLAGKLVVHGIGLRCVARLTCNAPSAPTRRPSRPSA
jgi:hypothetical protein